MPTPRLAASSSLKVSGILICKSPFTAMYSANAPSFKLVLFDPSKMPQLRFGLQLGILIPVRQPEWQRKVCSLPSLIYPLCFPIKKYPVVVEEERKTEKGRHCSLHARHLLTAFSSTSNTMASAEQNAEIGYFLTPRKVVSIPGMGVAATSTCTIEFLQQVPHPVLRTQGYTPICKPE
jgi:hypothetical protein